MVWMAPKADTTPEQMDEGLAAIRGLGHIPDVLSIDTGCNLTDRAGGATHGAMITLTGIHALPSYIEHTDHQTVGRLLRDICTVTVMDIET